MMKSKLLVVGAFIFVLLCSYSLVESNQKNNLENYIEDAFSNLVCEKKFWSYKCHNGKWTYEICYDRDGYRVRYRANGVDLTNSWNYGTGYSHKDVMSKHGLSSSDQCSSGKNTKNCQCK